MNRHQLIPWIFTLVILGTIISFFWFALIKPDLDNLELCANKLDISYNLFNGEGDVGSLRYNYIGNNHFNCCWNEIYLNDEGYYTKVICKGFIK